MARNYESPDIFQPTSFPEHTYVDRSIDNHETYEDRLRKALRTKGILALITGASKSGKTVLCYKVIEEDSIVEISGSHIRNSEDFWIQIAEKLEFPLEVETTSQNNTEVSFTGEMGGKAGIPLIADINLKGGAGTKLSELESTKEKQQRSKNYMIDYLIEQKKILVIDDFHYISQDIQLYIARILKSEIFHGLKAVIVSLPHRSDDAIRLNPDLIGRVRYINIEPWSRIELRKIPEVGFSLLGVSVSNEILDSLVQESMSSPQLIQQNCLNLAFVKNIDEDLSIRSIVDINDLHKAYVETTRDHENYESVIKRLTTGPPQGKEKRTQYSLKNGNDLDIYHVILHALAEDPPLIRIELETLQQKISLVLNTNERTPSNLNVSNALSQIQKALYEKGEMFQILEWKEQHLYILDSFFLFYLRWRVQ